MNKKSLKDNISDFFFPNRCPFCDGFIPYDRLCCDECASKIETAEFCPVCGKKICECKESSFSYDGCATLLPYLTTAREGILALKYSRGFNTAKLFVPRLFEKLRKLGYLDGASIITAVPMSRSRRARTGYNHSEYIAKELSALSGIPVDFSLIKKKNSAPLQHNLSVKEREQSAREAYIFGQNKNLSGLTLIICDDIITTGSTLSVCAAILKKMGAAKVYGAVLASTILENKDATVGNKE